MNLRTRSALRFISDRLSRERWLKSGRCLSSMVNTGENWLFNASALCAAVTAMSPRWTSTNWQRLHGIRADCWRTFLLSCRIHIHKTLEHDSSKPLIVQYNTIQYNTIQYNTIIYNTIQYNTILYYNTIQYNIVYFQHRTQLHYNNNFLPTLGWLERGWTEE